MAICLKCGRQVGLMGRECPYCHAPLNFNNMVDDSIKNVKDLNVDYDAKSSTIMYKSIFIPYGIYLYLINKDDSPLKASSALGGIMIGVIILLAFIIFIMLAAIL